MRVFIVLGAIIIAATALTTYTDSIFISRNYRDENSYHSIGYFQVNDVVSVNINFPEPSGGSPSQIYVTIADSSHFPIPGLGGGFNTPLSIPTSPGMLPTLTGTIMKPDYYSIRVQISGSGGGFSIQAMEMEIKRNGNVVYRIVDTPRVQVKRLIYLENSKTISVRVTGKG